MILNSREPGTYIWLMVIMEMVKEFPSGEALAVQPHKVINSRSPVHLLDSDVLR